MYDLPRAGKPTMTKTSRRMRRTCSVDFATATSGRGVSPSHTGMDVNFKAECDRINCGWLGTPGENDAGSSMSWGNKALYASLAEWLGTMRGTVDSCDLWRLPNDWLT
jgi:hypothetical protein